MLSNHYFLIIFLPINLNEYVLKNFILPKFDTIKRNRTRKGVRNIVQKNMDMIITMRLKITVNVSKLLLLR